MSKILCDNEGYPKFYVSHLFATNFCLKILYKSIDVIN
jgi:hypothetical protein